MEHLQNHLNNSTEYSKHNYYLGMAKKLISIQKSSKAGWSLLKSFLNNKKFQLFNNLYKIMKLQLILTDFTDSTLNQ